MSSTPVLSLYELNSLIRGVLNQTFLDYFWIRAELSDVRYNQNGHCYLEFIEKNDENQVLIAKARGSIWANTFRLLKPYFESETGQRFTSGLKVLVQVSVEFHELYGFSLTVHNIDPSYTLGDQVRNRTLVLNQLKEEGVLTLNKELELALIPQRIAVISSATAAGYEDFCNQLDNNSAGIIFYTHLFPALMQGDQTEKSIIAALEKIYKYSNLFDVVVIIRGGGATSDLSSFDSYLLAASCAQFPLPIITGIGHERDDTVLDTVAHTRTKTPTAVAEFLINRAQIVVAELSDLQNRILFESQKIIQKNKYQIENLSTRFSYLTKDRAKDQLELIGRIEHRLNHLIRSKLIEENALLETLKQRLSFLVSSNLQKEKHLLANMEQYLKLVSPYNILKKGYTLTLKDGKVVTSVDVIKRGDRLTTRFYDGDIVVDVN